MNDIIITIPFFDSPVLRVLFMIFLMLLAYKVSARFINPVSWLGTAASAIKGLFS